MKTRILLVLLLLIFSLSSMQSEALERPRPIVEADVWVVTYGPQSFIWIVGLFSSREIAEEFMAKYPGSCLKVHPYNFDQPIAWVVHSIESNRTMGFCCDGPGLNSADYPCDEGLYLEK